MVMSYQKQKIMSIGGFQFLELMKKLKLLTENWPGTVFIASLALFSPTGAKYLLQFFIKPYLGWQLSQSDHKALSAFHLKISGAILKLSPHSPALLCIYGFNHQYPIFFSAEYLKMRGNAVSP